jgi:hypothetical protein
MNRRLFLKLFGLIPFINPIIGLLEKSPVQAPASIPRPVAIKSFRLDEVRFYSGVVPASADDKASGVLLAKLPYLAGVYQGRIDTSGLATYARLVNKDDDDKFSTTWERIQFTL